MQAVEVAVGHIAERHIIKGEAELVLVEAAHRDAQRPFIRAVGIGRGDADAGQMCKSGDGTCAGRRLQQELGVDGLLVTRGTGSGDGDGFRGRDLLRWIGRLLCGGIGGRTLRCRWS